MISLAKGWRKGKSSKTENFIQYSFHSSQTPQKNYSHAPIHGNECYVRMLDLYPQEGVPTAPKYLPAWYQNRSNREIGFSSASFSNKYPPPPTVLLEIMYGDNGESELSPSSRDNEVTVMSVGTACITKSTLPSSNKQPLPYLTCQEVVWGTWISASTWQ